MPDPSLVNLFKCFALYNRLSLCFFITCHFYLDISSVTTESLFPTLIVEKKILKALYAPGIVLGIVEMLSFVKQINQNPMYSSILFSSKRNTQEENK